MKPTPRSWALDPLTTAVLAIVLAEFFFKAGDYFSLWGEFSTRAYFGRDLYTNFYTQLLAWKAGLWNVYSAEERASWPPDIASASAPAMYPPFALWLHLPLQAQPWEAVTRSYLWVSQMCTVLSVALIAWGFRRGPLLPVLCLPLLLWSGPGVDTLFAGQLNAWMALTMVAFSVFWIRGYKLTASVALGLGIASKLFPAFLLLLLWRKREVRMVVWTIATSLVLHLPLLMYSQQPSIFVGFLQSLPRVLRVQIAYDNMSVAGVLAQTFTPGEEWICLWDAPWFGRILALLISVVLVVLTYRRIEPGVTTPQRLSQELALVLMLVLLVPSLSWAYYGIYAIYAYLLFWLGCPNLARSRDWFLASTLALGVLCLFGGQIGGSSLRVFAMVTMMQYHLAFFLYLGLWGGAYKLLRRA